MCFGLKISYNIDKTNSSNEYEKDILHSGHCRSNDSRGLLRKGGGRHHHRNVPAGGLRCSDRTPYCILPCISSCQGQIPCLASNTGTAITTGDISGKNIKLSAATSYLNFAVPEGDFTNFTITITDINDKTYALSAASLTLKRAMMNKVTFALDAKDPAAFVLNVNGHTVRIVYSSDEGIKDDVWIKKAEVVDNSVKVTAQSVSGQHLKCTMDDSGDFCTSQSKTDNLAYTFTISDITVNTTATIGYAKPVRIAVTPDKGGSVEISDGELYEGDTVTLKAVPAYEYGFDAWLDKDGNPLVCEEETYPNVRLSSDGTSVKFKENLVLGGVFTVADGGKGNVKKVRFYTNLYHSMTRNTFSDVNGEWRDPSETVRKVDDPVNDRALGCDAFWNSMWNLNQVWNLLTPEWASRWVRSQIDLYKYCGFLSKGPAGMEYIPVMEAQHEIPLMVAAWQMGIRDFDAELALKAMIHQVNSPLTPVCGGWEGNEDLGVYLKYHYVPCSVGRCSNTFEYSYDDWTVGQFAKALGHEDIYKEYNDRGGWWRNGINPANGYAHLRDINGKFVDGFDPFGKYYEYTESNGWQIGFFVPQDVEGLASVIETHNASPDNIYVQKAVLNGRELSEMRIPASELLKGGKLELWMVPQQR